MSKQTDMQGQTTYNKDDKHPHRRKVQVAIHKTSSPQKKLLVTRTAGKHLTPYDRRYPRKHLPLSERKQVTQGEFVYKRCETFGHRDKWYKLYKGESVEDAIRIRGQGRLEAILVDSPPIEK